MPHETKSSSPAARSVRHAAEGERGRCAGTVLLAEDEAAVRDLAAAVLRGAGLHVIACQDGEAALCEARERPDGFDLLLTDVMMPGMNGYELARLLRAQRVALPVVYMSGNPVDEVALHGVPDSHHLAKPVPPDLLVVRVCALLDEARTG